MDGSSDAAAPDAAAPGAAPPPPPAPASPPPAPASAFGWHMVGERLLREFSVSAGAVESAPTVRWAKTWTEIKALPIVPQLTSLAVQQMALLHAVDAAPAGGLCQGPPLKEALRRYERLWLPLLAAQAEAAGAGGDPAAGYGHLVPPLDVALMWHLHRLQPEAYAADCAELRTRSGRRSPALHPTAAQAFAFSDGASEAAGAATAALWRQVHGSKEPFWPPAPPGSQTAAFRSRLSADLAAVAVRVPVFTHQLLRAPYASLAFLNRAVDRYCKFLLLRKHHLELQHPIPPLDIGLVWAAHMSVSGAYAADCQQLLGRPFVDLPGAGASLWLERDSSGPWRFHFTDTQRAWRDEFDEPLVVPGSGYVPLSSPHPAEGAFSSKLLAAFEQGAPAKQQPWRAGAHALFLTWLRDPNLALQQQYQEQLAHYHLALAQHESRGADLPLPQSTLLPPPSPNHHHQQQQQHKKKGGGGLFACFGCGGADADEDATLQRSAAAAAQRAAAAQEQEAQQQQRLAAHRAATPVAPHPPAHVAVLSEEQLGGLVAGFPTHQHLPLTVSHPYWLQLLPRADDGAVDVASAEAGAEIEVFGAAGTGRGAGRAANGRDMRPSDQGMLVGDYEVAVGRAAPLRWS